MSQPDFVESHRRNILAAGDRQVPDHILETVDLNFRKSPFPPWDTRLEVVQAPELLNADLETVKAYTHQHLLSTLTRTLSRASTSYSMTARPLMSLRGPYNGTTSLVSTKPCVSCQNTLLLYSGDYCCFAEDFERISPLKPLEHLPDINFK